MLTRRCIPFTLLTYAVLIAGCASMRQGQEESRGQSESRGQHESSEQGEPTTAVQGEASGDQRFEDRAENPQAGEITAEDGEEGTFGETETAESGLEASETDEERVGRLDGELDESLAEFDSMLSKEMAAIADRRKQAEEEALRERLGDRVKGPADGQTEQAAGEEVAATDAQDPLAAQDPVTEGKSKPSTYRALGSHGGNYGPKGPPIVDEDIIARQLREAFENETDPALREKLWQEYVKYQDRQLSGAFENKSSR